MKRYIRFKSVLAGLLAAVTVFGVGSCRGNPSDDVTESLTETEATLASSVLRLIDEGSPVCRVVYPTQSNACLTEALDALQSGVKKSHGVNFSTVSDQLTTAGNTELPLILLGETTFEASVSAASALPENAFSITVLEKQVVIVASNDALYRTAIEHLLAACTATDGALTLPTDYSYTSQSYEVYPLIVNGSSSYSIVYAHQVSNAKECAESLQKAIFEATGTRLNVLSDAESMEGDCEILIGNTDRAFSRQSACKFFDFGISWDGKSNSIALTGTVENAVARFAGLVGALGTKGELSLVTPVFGTFQPKGYGRIPAYREEYDLLRASDFNSYYVLYYESDADEYGAYLTRLETDEGFAKHAYREVNGNLFSTYTDGETVLTVNYTKYTGTVRITAETTESCILPSLTNEVTNTVTTPQLTQFNGACAFMLRLSDGRFMIMDGGMNYERNWQSIYDQLCEQNVLEGKPVIAAWILSHAHVDHFGGFLGFSERYSSYVTLENIVVNLPSYEIYSQNTEASNVTPDMQTTIQAFQDTMKLKYPQTQLVIPHAGQQMYFGDALIDMLYTHEELAPEVMKVTNSSTLIYTVTIAGQKLTFLNDAHDDSSYIVYRMYGETLKTDIVQIAHHGYNGGNTAMYEKMAADTALWTSPYQTILEGSLWNNPRNNFDIDSVKENLMMEDWSVMVIPLPHAVGALPAYVRSFS